MRRLASRPLPQARFACARLPRWPASAPSSVAGLSTDSSSPKGAAAAGGSLDKGRRRTAPDRTVLLARLLESGESQPTVPLASDDKGRRSTAQDRIASFRMREAGASQFSNDGSPTVPLAASLTTSQIANTLRGYAQRQERPVDALQALAAELPRRSNLGFRSLIDSCRALAQLHVVDPAVWGALGDCADGLISSGTEEATHQRLAAFGVSFAQADHAHRLFTQPDSAYWQRVAEFEEQAAARLVPRGVDPSVEQVASPQPRVTAAELAEPVLRQRWRGSQAAVARWTGSEVGQNLTGEAGAPQPQTVDRGAASDTDLEAAIARYKGRQTHAKVQRRHNPSDATSNQLHLTQLWLRARGAAAPIASVHRARWLRSYRASAPPSTFASQLEYEVYYALVRAGLGSVRQQHCTPEGLSVDLVLRIDGKDVLIETDGPDHYVTSTLHGQGHGQEPVLTGKAALKHRLLRACGHTFVALPFWEWKFHETVMPSYEKALEASAIQHQLSNLVDRCRREIDRSREQASVAKLDHAEGEVAPANLLGVEQASVELAKETAPIAEVAPAPEAAQEDAAEGEAWNENALSAMKVIPNPNSNPNPNPNPNPSPNPNPNPNLHEGGEAQGALQGARAAGQGKEGGARRAAARLI